MNDFVCMVKQREDLGTLPGNLYWGILEDVSGHLRRAGLRVKMSLVFELTEFELLWYIQKDIFCR